MLSFATEFPVNAERGSSAFIAVIGTWIIGSPHYSFSKADIESIPVSGDWSLQKDGAKLEVLRLHLEKDEYAAVQIISNDGDLEWVTAIVYSCVGSEAWVGVRTSRESLHPTKQLPPAK